MERISKIIARAGIVSRRKAEQLILSNRVKVNDKIVNVLGTKISLNDHIKIDNKIINSQQEQKVYFLFNKPPRCISSVSDPSNRKTVLDFFVKENQNKRLFPVGRLDFFSEGLLLITNDGFLTQKLTHPSFLVKKTYEVWLKGIFPILLIKQIKNKGIIIDKTFLAKPLDIFIKKIDNKKNFSILHIVLTEGRNRQIRKMMECVEFKILKLIRIKYHFLTIDHLSKGQYRKLTYKEIQKLKNITVKKESI